jgi:hypothetical protein
MMKFHHVNIFEMHSWLYEENYMQWILNVYMTSIIITFFYIETVLSTVLSI